MRLTSGERNDGGRARGGGGRRRRRKDGGRGGYCCISMGAVQIPRDYWREKRRGAGGREKNDARFLGSVMTG